MQLSVVGKSFVGITVGLPVCLSLVGLDQVGLYSALQPSLLEAQGSAAFSGGESFVGLTF